MKYYAAKICDKGTIAVDDTLLVKDALATAGSRILDGFKPLFSAEAAANVPMTFQNLNVVEWNAEIPTLYTAYIILKKNGEAVQYIRSYIGFKNVKINL